MGKVEDAQEAELDKLKKLWEEKHLTAGEEGAFIEGWEACARYILKELGGKSDWDPDAGEHVEWRYVLEIFEEETQND